MIVAAVSARRSDRSRRAATYSPLIRSTSTQILLLGFVRGGEPSNSCLRSRCCARRLAASNCSSSRTRASLERFFPHCRRLFDALWASLRSMCAFWSPKWRSNQSSMQGFDIARRIWLACAMSMASGTLPCSSMSNTHQILIGQLVPPTILALLLHSLLDESPRAAVEMVEHDQHPRPVQLEPVPEVLDLRFLPFGEDMQLPATCVAGGLGSARPTPARPAHLSACTSSAATPKSPSERIGLPP